MTKKLKIIIALAATLFLVATGIAVPAIAQEDTENTAPEVETRSFLARVAEILGDVSEEELANAFEEARRELREDAFFRIIDKALDKGLIDETEATAIKEWWQQRPDALKRIPILPFGKTAQPVHPGGSSILPWPRPVITKVAGILGIAEEDLANALKEARQEIKSELSGRTMNNAAQKGIIQEKTNKIRQRLEQDSSGKMKRLGVSSSGARHQTQASGSNRALLNSATP